MTFHHFHLAFFVKYGILFAGNRTELQEPHGEKKMCDIEDSDLVSRVNAWKTEMRKQFHVPDEYDILMNYGENNDIDAWIDHCSKTNTICDKKHEDWQIFYSCRRWKHVGPER